MSTKKRPLGDFAGYSESFELQLCKILNFWIYCKLMSNSGTKIIILTVFRSDGSGIPIRFIQNFNYFSKIKLNNVGWTECCLYPLNVINIKKVLLGCPTLN